MDLEKTKKIIRYKDKLGNEIDKDTWEQLYENDNYKIIKQERIDKFFISTMWLGISHFDFKNQDFFEGFNAYFETMVFEFYSDDICRSCDIYRYCTLEEAKEGHEIVAKEYRDKKEL
jgi:hypothetical protein